MIVWTTNEKETGLTALQWLQNRVPSAPAAYLRQLLRGGKIRCENQPLSESTLLRSGQKLSLPDSARLRQLLAQRTEPGVEVLFESREILVVFKPAGLAIHRAPGHEEENLTDRVQALLIDRGAPFRTAPVHRLDVQTSGPVIFGKGRKAASELGKLFMNAQVKKTYLALVEGRMERGGVLETPVRAKGKLKAAATDCTVLTATDHYTLLKLRLLSGRKHQIRQQLAALGHPLAGDRRYGGGALPEPGALFLHCAQLSLPDPFGGPPLHIESPLPEYLARVLKGIGITPPVAFMS